MGMWKVLVFPLSLPGRLHFGIALTEPAAFIPAAHGLLSLSFHTRRKRTRA